MSTGAHPGPLPAGPRPPDEFFRAIERQHATRRDAPSARLYRVRPSRPSDHPLLANGAATASHLVTIHRIDGARMILPARWGWADTDAWAGWRWRKADADRQAERWGGAA